MSIIERSTRYQDKAVTAVYDTKFHPGTCNGVLLDQWKRVVGELYPQQDLGKIDDITHESLRLDADTRMDVSKLSPLSISEYLKNTKSLTSGGVFDKLTAKAAVAGRGGKQASDVFPSASNKSTGGHDVGF